MIETLIEASSCAPISRNTIDAHRCAPLVLPCWRTPARVSTAPLGPASPPAFFGAEHSAATGRKGCRALSSIRIGSDRPQLAGVKVTCVRRPAAEGHNASRQQSFQSRIADSHQTRKFPRPTLPAPAWDKSRQRARAGDQPNIPRHKEAMSAPASRFPGASGFWPPTAVFALSEAAGWPRLGRRLRPHAVPHPRHFWLYDFT